MKYPGYFLQNSEDEINLSSINNHYLLYTSRSRTLKAIPKLIDPTYVLGDNLFQRDLQNPEIEYTPKILIVFSFLGQIRFFDYLWKS